MAQERIVVLGAGGMLGKALVEMIGPAAIALRREEVDITDREKLSRSIPVEARVIVNSAALIDVDECERRGDVAFATNAIGAWNVARVANDRGLTCVYVSTDHVFDGAAKRPFVESDVLNPVNVYGASKAAGEFLTRSACAESLVVRTSQLFGDSPRPNIVERIIRQARERGHISAAIDVAFSPTYNVDLAAAMVSALSEGIKGTLHLASSTSCSRFDFTRAVIELSQVDCEVEPTTAADIRWSAPRPLNTVMASEREVPALPSWQDGLARYFRTRTESGSFSR